MDTKERKRKNLKYIIFITCFFVVILTYFTYKVYSGYTEKNDKIKAYTELGKKFSYDIRHRNDLIKGYEELKQNEKYFSYKQLSVIYGNLAVLYVLQNEYEKAVDCSVYATNYSELSGDLYMKAWCLNNVANIFIDMGVFNIAEDMFKEALNTPIKDPLEDILIKEYTKVNLAEIYSRDGRDEEARRIISIKGDWNKLSEYNENMIETIRKIIESRINLNREDYKEASDIIDTIEYDEGTTDEIVIKNIVISKLELQTHLYLATNRYDEAKNTSDKYISICDKNKFKLEKTKYLNEFYKLTQRYNTPFPVEYSNFLMKEYPALINDRNGASSKFIMYTHNRSKEYLKKINKNMEYNIILGMLFFISIIFSYLLIKKLIKANKRGKIDALTQLNNRRYFDVTYKKCLASKVEFGIIFIDIDHFKNVNDIYGHEFGDMVLKKIGVSLVKNIRKNDKAFRYGGEEFCVICKTEYRGDVINIAEGLRKCVEDIQWDNGIHVTISLGVSHSKDKGDLINIADKNMYESKVNGRNRVTS